MNRNKSLTENKTSFLRTIVSEMKNGTIFLSWQSGAL